MVQYSLLVNSGIPDNPDALQSWVERLRSRIVNISRQIASLENEKRTLLIKLEEAGLSTMSIDADDVCDLIQPLPSTVTVIRKPSVESDGVLVVDLLESSQSETKSLDKDQTMELELQPNEPVFSDTETEPNADGPDSVLDDLDPHELSFELSQPPVLAENEAPSNELPTFTNTVSRVYKISEFTEIDWTAVSSSELKHWLQFFGLKPTLGGRKVMVDKLAEIFNYACPTSKPLSIDPTTVPKPESSRTSLFTDFRSSITSNAELYDKIVCFETVDVVLVFDHLRQCMPDHSFSIKHVKEYLDHIHVQYCTTSEKFLKKRRRVQEAKPKRAIRKSISCPM